MSNESLYAEGENPWDRRQDESGRAYAAFCLYRNQGTNRSLDGVYCESRGLPAGSKQASGCFLGWSRDYAWKSRAEAYDSYTERLNRAGREEQYNADLESFRQRQKSLGRASLASAVNLLNKANDALKALDSKDITPSVVSSMFRAAAAVALLASNLEASSLGIEALIRDMANEEATIGA